jgi:HK97 family phage prohead protease
MELKVFRSSEIKASSEDLTFEGYANVFGVRDSWDDIVEEGAFKKTIKENIKRIKVLNQHNYTQVIGRPLTLGEDKKGLEFKAKISDTTLGRDVYTLIKDKALTEMSIGYNAVKWEYDEDEGIRYLKEIRLWEISPVTWAANEFATISKQMLENYDIMESEIKRLEALVLKFKDIQSKNEPPPSTNPDIQLALNEIRKFTT